MEQKQEIIIDLEGLEKTEAFEEKDLIYHTEFEKLRKGILSLVAENKKAEKHQLRYQPCFFINGSRGSGKTTLLRALQKRVCSNEPGNARIHLLAEIDPTKLSDGENFFIYIISYVQKEIVDITKRCGDIDCRENLYELRREISKLAEGLAALIHQPGPMDNMGDAQFYVQESVEGGMSSAHLHSMFFSIVERFCKLIRVDALMIMVDDADMNFNKCRDVFETIRKYLLNRHMVFVFAGDLRLYTHVVRGMQMRHFGEMALKYDSERRKQRLNLLDDLEEQYIMKLFPINNHVRLSGFGRVMNQAGIRISYRDATNEQHEKDLKKYIDEYLPEKVTCYVPALMRKCLSMLHMRSALQLLACWTRNSYEGMSEKDACLAWSRGVALVTSHALMKYNIEPSNIYEGDLHTLISTIRHFVPKLKMGMDGAMLLHSVGSELNQLASFFLSTEVSRQVRSHQDQLYYMLVLFCMLQKDATTELTLQSNIVCETPLFYARQIASNFTALMLPVWKGTERLQKRFANGVVPLLSYDQIPNAKVQKRQSVHKCMAEMLETLEKKPDRDALLYYLAIVHSLSVIVENNRSYYCLSVYNMIAWAIQLLQVMSYSAEKRKDYIKDFTFNIRDIKSTVRYVEASGSYVGNEQSEDLLEELSDKFEKVLEQNDALVDDVVNKIEKWIEDCHEQKILVTTASMVNCWHAFMRESMLATKAARVISADARDLVMAGNLFAEYMSAWNKALEVGTEKITSLDEQKELAHINQLMNCPVWRIIKGVNPNQSEAEDTTLESVIRCFNQVNIGQVEILFNPSHLKSFYDSRLRMRKARMEYSLRNEIDELILEHRRKLMRWCDNEGEKVSSMLTEAVQNQMRKDTGNRFVSYDELSENEKMVFNNRVRYLMKRIKNRNDTNLNTFWQHLDNKKMEGVIHEFNEELSNQAKSLWEDMQHDLNQVSNEEEATKFIDLQIQEFANKHRHLIHVYREYAENETNMSVLTWKREYAEYVEETIKKLPKPTSRKKKKEQE